MDEKQKKLKELLRDALPLLEEFIGEEGIEEEGPFGRSDQDVEEDILKEGYQEDVELDEKETDEELDNDLNKEVKDVFPENDKELRKRIAAAAISKKLGKDKKSK